MHLNLLNDSNFVIISGVSLVKKLLIADSELSGKKLLNMLSLDVKTK